MKEGGTRVLGGGEGGGGKGALRINLDLAPGCWRHGSRTEAEKLKLVLCSQNGQIQG